MIIAVVIVKLETREKRGIQKKCVYPIKTFSEYWEWRAKMQVLPSFYFVWIIQYKIGVSPPNQLSLIGWKILFLQNESIVTLFFHVVSRVTVRSFLLLPSFDICVKSFPSSSFGSLDHVRHRMLVTFRPKEGKKVKIKRREVVFAS